jgi:hypothetical protein
LFFFVKITVVGTTITVITTIPAMIPRIIHIFFLRVIASLKASKSSLYYSLQMTYSVIETESDADSTLLAIERDFYTKSMSKCSCFFNCDVALTL